MYADDIVDAVIGADGVIAISGGRTKGIRISHTDSGPVIDISVILKAGVRIPDTAWQLQQSVKSATIAAGNPEPTAININISGIRES